MKIETMYMKKEDPPDVPVFQLDAPALRQKSQSDFEAEVTKQLSFICKKLDTLFLQVCESHLQVASADLPPFGPPRTTKPVLVLIPEESELCPESAMIPESPSVTSAMDAESSLAAIYSRSHSSLDKAEASMVAKRSRSHNSLDKAESSMTARRSRSHSSLDSHHTSNTHGESEESEPRHGSPRKSKNRKSPKNGELQLENVVYCSSEGDPKSPKTGGPQMEKIPSILPGFERGCSNQSNFTSNGSNKGLKLFSTLTTIRNDGTNSSQPPSPARQRSPGMADSWASSSFSCVSNAKQGAQHRQISHNSGPLTRRSLMGIQAAVGHNMAVLQARRASQTGLASQSGPCTDFLPTGLPMKMSSVEFLEDEEVLESSAGTLDEPRPERSTMSRTQSSMSVGPRKSRVAMKVWRMLDDSESSSWALSYRWMMLILIGASTLTPMLEAIDQWQGMAGNKLACAVLEMLFDCTYTLDIILRFVVCPNRCAFFFSLHNVIDSLSLPSLVARCSVGAVLPTVVEAEGASFCLLVFLPSLRMLKLLRYMPNFALLWGAFQLAFETLPSMMYALAQITLMFSAVIYTCEWQEGSMDFSDSYWMTIVTMTTVGYGDIVPQTVPGRIVTSVLVIVSMLYMAIPLGLIGHAFTEVWADRHRILLVQRARDCISQWGYTADSLMGLFKHFDADGSGEIDLLEFRTMIEEMGIGMTDVMVEKLFTSFDKTGTNNISDVEFVQALFPTYSRVLASANDQDREDPVSPFASPRFAVCEGGDSLVKDETVPTFSQGS